MRRRFSIRDSLQARLLAGLFAVVLVLLMGSSYHAYRQALAAATTAYDRSLLAVARIIAERVDLREGRVTVEVPYVALDFFEADVRGRAFYRVSGLGGEFVSGFDDLPGVPEGLPRSEEYFALARFYDTVYRATPVRVVALHQPVADETHRGMALIQVAETLDSREHITERLLRGTMLRHSILVILVAVVIIVVVRMALRPVERLGRELGAREPTDLSPLQAERVPAEIRPMVEGMNEYMRRLAELLRAQERFIADAAHQLRTPLTLVQTQAELAARESDAAKLHEFVGAIRASVSDTVTLAEQLLSHAHATHRIASPAFADVDLAAVARKVALDLAPRAVARDIDLGFEAEGAIVIRGDATLLRELVRNLVDNAIRYGPARGRVTVRVARGERILLEVEDSGTGIPPAVRERAFDAFVRIEGGDEPGAGLGLTIARDVARAHGASIELVSPEGTRGFRVRVAFPSLEQ